jgi:hypothetical protein
MDYVASRKFAFSDIIQKHQISAPYIIIECKNYEDNIGNPALDQLAGRFSNNRGVFGLLVYRKSSKEEEFFQNCISHRRDRRNECIIPLNDNDIIEMLNLKLQNEDMNDLLRNKLQSLDFGNIAR